MYKHIRPLRLVLINNNFLKYVVSAPYPSPQPRVRTHSQCGVSRKKTSYDARVAVGVQCLLPVVPTAARVHCAFWLCVCSALPPSVRFMSHHLLLLLPASKLGSEERARLPTPSLRFPRRLLKSDHFPLWRDKFVELLRMQPPLPTFFFHCELHSCSGANSISFTSNAKKTFYS